MNIVSADAPLVGAQVSFVLPPDVAAPKFHLFQEVYYCKRKGVVVGMRYICPLEALAESTSDWGWSYTISDIFGKTPQEALLADETTEYVYERSLHCCLCPPCQQQGEG